MHNSIHDCFEASSFEATGQTVIASASNERHEVQQCRDCERQVAEVFDLRDDSFLGVAQR